MPPPPPPGRAHVQFGNRPNSTASPKKKRAAAHFFRFRTQRRGVKMTAGKQAGGAWTGRVGSGGAWVRQASLIGLVEEKMFGNWNDICQSPTKKCLEASKIFMPWSKSCGECAKTRHRYIRILAKQRWEREQKHSPPPLCFISSHYSIARKRT